jgi:hypothetical protein
MENVAGTIITHWIIPIMKYFRKNNFSNLGTGSVAFKHVSVVIRQSLKEFLFEPVVILLINEIEFLQEFDNFVIGKMENIEDAKCLKAITGSSFNKTLKEINKVMDLPNLTDNISY